MPYKGPILIIDDDPDDVDILKYALAQLKVLNEIIWFNDTDEFIRYLKGTEIKPFIIFCDINMPKENGIALKARLDKDAHLRRKSIPFIFYTTTAAPSLIDTAYSELTVQGIFEKGSDTGKITETMKYIINYWRQCIYPNSV